MKFQVAALSLAAIARPALGQTLLESNNSASFFVYTNPFDDPVGGPGAYNAYFSPNDTLGQPQRGDYGAITYPCVMFSLAYVQQIRAGWNTGVSAANSSLNWQCVLYTNDRCIGDEDPTQAFTLTPYPTTSGATATIMAATGLAAPFDDHISAYRCDPKATATAIP